MPGKIIEINNILDVKKYVENIKVVIFDLDDTLYSEKNYVKSGYHAISEKFSSIINMDDKLWRAFTEGKNAIDEVLNSEGLLTCENKKLALDTYRNHFPNISLYDGVRDMLEELSKSKHLGMITDGRPKGQRLKIDALDIEKYFRKIIITDELGGMQFRKPNPKAFELMHDFFNVDYSNMCYIGDNLNKDFVSPEKLEMQSIHFNNSDGLYSGVR